MFEHIVVGNWFEYNGECWQKVSTGAAVNEDGESKSFPSATRVTPSVDPRTDPGTIDITQVHRCCGDHDSCEHHFEESEEDAADDL